MKWLLIILTGFVISFCINPVKASEGLTDEEYEERQCLVEAIYFEARSESILAQLAIANVILERVKLANFPNTASNEKFEIIAQIDSHIFYIQH